MFLIAGVQPRTHRGPKTDQICPRCGLARVYERRLDHYFSLFFIPLVRVKKGTNFSWCEGCQAPLSGTGGGNGPRSEPSIEKPVCPGCGQILAPQYRFCPYCGRPQS
jgi:RNA polymerase subunit RPABC4/transcription elongation factor Spt4